MAVSLTRALLVLTLAACGTPSGARGTDTPDARRDDLPLSRTTNVKADRVRLVLSDHWRGKLKLDAVRVDRSDPQRQIARGSAVLTLKRLRVEAREIEVRWVADHEDILLYAQNVALFHQERKAPYHSTELFSVTMANDEVSFFK